MTKMANKSQIMTHNTYLNICGFYGIEDVFDESTFNDNISAGSLIDIYNANTDASILILCSGSKYTQQTVTATMRKIKRKLQLIVTNNVSHPKVLSAFTNRFKTLITDICPQQYFQFSTDHVLKKHEIIKYTHSEYIAKERCGIYNDDCDYNTTYLKECDIVQFNLKVKDLALRRFATFYRDNKSDQTLKQVDYSIYLQPLNNINAFLSVDNKLDQFYGGLITDNSRFIDDPVTVQYDELFKEDAVIAPTRARVDVEAPENLMKVRSGKDVVFSAKRLSIKDAKKTINDKYYVNLENIIKEHNKNSIQVGDFVVVNNLLVDHPITYQVRAQPEVYEINANL